MRKNTFVVILLMILVATNALATAYPEPSAWVNDYAGVLTSDQQQELDGLLKNFETATTNQIFVCIMPNLPAETTLEAYVNELFAHWKPGQQGKDNGVLLAIFINDRKLRVEVGYGLEAKLTDAASKLIIANDITPSFKQGEYYQGVKNGLDKMMRTITGEYQPQPSTTQPGTAQPRESPPREPRSRNIWIDVLLNALLSEDGPLIGVGAFIFIMTLVVAVRCIIKEGWVRSSSSSSSSDSDSNWTSSSSWSDDDDDDDDSGFSGGGGGSSGGGGASGSW